MKKIRMLPLALTALLLLLSTTYTIFSGYLPTVHLTRSISTIGPFLWTISIFSFFCSMRVLTDSDKLKVQLSKTEEIY